MWSGTKTIAAAPPLGWGTAVGLCACRPRLSGVAGSDGPPLVGCCRLAAGADERGVRPAAVRADVQVSAPCEAAPAAVKVAADLLAVTPHP